MELNALCDFRLWVLTMFVIFSAQSSFEMTEIWIVRASLLLYCPWILRSAYLHNPAEVAALWRFLFPSYPAAWDLAIGLEGQDVEDSVWLLLEKEV